MKKKQWILIAAIAFVISIVLLLFPRVGIAGIIIATIVFLVWLGLSIKIVGPAEMAVRVIFGKPEKFPLTGFVDSGLCLVPFLPGCYLVRYPKKLYNLDYPGRKVVSSEGEFEGRQYGAQVLQVDSVAYARFPRNEKLIEILKSKVPIEDKDLKDWTEESVVGSLRVVLGRITWKEATEEIEKVRIEANKLFKAQDGALLRAGFFQEDLRLTIKEIRIPPKLEKLLLEVDRQRLEAEAAPFEAEQRAEETMGAMIQMMAKATGRTLSEIRQEIESDPKLKEEFRDFAKDLVHRRMAIDGKSFIEGRFPEGTTVEGLLTLLKRMPMGKEEKKEKEEEEEEEEEGKKEATEEDIKRWEKAFQGEKKS